MRILKITSKGVVLGVVGLPLAAVLALGAALVAGSLLGIFLVMDVLNKINGQSQYL